MSPTRIPFLRLGPPGGVPPNAQGPPAGGGVGGGGGIGGVGAIGSNIGSGISGMTNAMPNVNFPTNLSNFSLPLTRQGSTTGPSPSAPASPSKNYTGERDRDRDREKGKRKR